MVLFKLNQLEANNNNRQTHTLYLLLSLLFSLKTSPKNSQVPPFANRNWAQTAFEAKKKKTLTQQKNNAKIVCVRREA